MASTDYIISLGDIIIGKKMYQQCNRYVCWCPECKQVTLKEPQSINLQLQVLQFPMSFISMDWLGPYHETEKGNQCALTIICMFTNYMFMIPLRSKCSDEVLKAYLTCVYLTFRGSKYILRNRGSDFTSKPFTWLANELGLIKVHTSPYTPTGNSIIEWTHACLKASLRKLICNHRVDWDEIACTAIWHIGYFYTPQWEKLHSI